MPISVCLSVTSTDRGRRSGRSPLQRILLLTLTVG